MNVYMYKPMELKNIQRRNTNFGSIQIQNMDLFLRNTVKYQAKQRYTQLIQSSVQGQVTNWQDKVIERKLSWKEIWSWTPARLSFLMKSTYDTLPSPSNLVRWKISQDDKCGWTAGYDETHPLQLPFGSG